MSDERQAMLLEARSHIVARYRGGSMWPDGIGAWYRPEDWTDAGDLTATGEAWSAAMDPHANDRAKGLPCPALVAHPDAVATETKRAAAAERKRKSREAAKRKDSDL